VSKLISKISPNSLNSANRSVFSWIVRPAVIILYPRRNAWWVKNLANIISTTRLPVSLAVVCYQVYPGYVARDYHRLYVGLAVMLVLLLSDGVDGALARGLLAVSRYGKAIDPLADKVFYLSSLIALLLGSKALVHQQAVIAMLILLIPALYYELRLVITALVTEKVCRKRQTVEPVGANTWGKTKFGLQALAIFLGLGLPWPTLGFSCAMILVAVSLPLAHLSLRGHQIDLESIRLKPCA
jgi:phosphatidylglycerophosphate synthase